MLNNNPDDSVKISLVALLRIITSSYPDDDLTVTKLSEPNHIYFEIDNGEILERCFYDLENMVAFGISGKWGAIVGRIKDGLELIAIARADEKEMEFSPDELSEGEWQEKYGGDDIVLNTDEIAEQRERFSEDGSDPNSHLGLLRYKQYPDEWDENDHLVHDSLRE